MITLKKKVLGLGLVASLLPAVWAGSEEGNAEGHQWVAENLENMIRGKLPSFEGVSCEAKACADGCTEECQKKTVAWKSKMKKNPTSYYASLFSKKPELWSAAGPEVERRFGEKRTTSEERARILSLVSEVPAAMKSELPAALWSVDPESFTTDQVIGFAMAKSGKCFVKNLAQKVEQSNAAYTAADIRPALFFAMRGDDRGRPTLARAIKKTDLEKGSVMPVLLAGRGLETLGVKGCLQRQRERVFEAAIQALDDGDLALARRITVQAQVFAESAKKGNKGKKGKKAYGGSWRSALSCASEDCGYCDEEEAMLATADDVLEAIERATPL